LVCAAAGRVKGASARAPAANASLRDIRMVISSVGF
jgi:hypothetical protein